VTSQVAVMNLSGVAIASDTAVTTWDEESRSYKVLGDVPKIYFPGDPHRFVIVHSNATQISGVPHRLHISEWFASLGKTLPTLQAYVDAYMTWSSSERRMSSLQGESSTLNFMLNEALHDLKYSLESSLTWYKEPEGTDRKKKLALEKFLSERVAQFYSQLEGLESYPGLSDKHANELLRNSGIDLEEKVNYIFSELPLKVETTLEIKNLSHLIISRKRVFESDSNLGFIGFGEDEAFPSVIRLNCRGIYGGGLRASTEEGRALSPIDDKSSIAYFAQFNSMWGFVNGVTAAVKTKYSGLIEEVVEREFGHTTDELIGRKIALEIEDEVQQFAQATFISPFLNTLEAMGMNGLADVAESLVGLQATSTYGNAGAATVGGVIEVVTIDRVSGVTWRKSLAT
jgi:hypothetical protein